MADLCLPENGVGRRQRARVFAFLVIKALFCGYNLIFLIFLDNWGFQKDNLKDVKIKKWIKNFTWSWKSNTFFFTVSFLLRGGVKWKVDWQRQIQILSTNLNTNKTRVDELGIHCVMTTQLDSAGFIHIITHQYNHLVKVKTVEREGNFLLFPNLLLILFMS